MAIKWMVPNVSRDLRERIRKEAYVSNEIIIRTELLKAQGKLNLSCDEEKDTLILEDAPLLQGENKNATESDGLITGDVTDGKIVL